MKSAFVLFLLSASLFLFGCTKAAKEEDATPKAETSQKKQLRPYTEKTLSNGLQVLLVEDKSLPYITYAMMVKTGAAADPDTQTGLGNFVAGLLEKGTNNKNAVQIAD